MAAVLLDGTIPNQVSRPGTGARPQDNGVDRDRPGPTMVRLRHPKGVVELRADVEGDTVWSVGVTRTARRLLRGQAFVVLP